MILKNLNEKNEEYELKLRIAKDGIVNDSVVDGPGIRLTVFVQGCNHHCKGCHNPHTHDTDGGIVVPINTIMNQIKDNPLLDGITISGGEPFLQPTACNILAKKVKELGLNVFVYTGFLYEELLQSEFNKRFLQNIDILVDGKFIEEQKSLALHYRGSSNQRVIDVKRSLENHSVVVHKWG